ncbi:MAG TPA: hypothetical protein VH062_02135 [Polyangiaceae bacterium]|nr:hypothetical protein [Polyangiaceae bacterium]
MSDVSVAKLQQQLDEYDRRERIALLGGVVATQVILAADDAQDGALGDVVVVGQNGPVPPAAPTVKRALTESLSNAGSVYGVLLQATLRGTSGFCALLGVLPASVTGLAANSNGLVRVGPTTGRCERVGSYSAGDFPVGTVDGAGNLTMCGPGVPGSNGAPVGGGDFSGPSSSVDGRPVLFNGTSGKLGKAGAINLADDSAVTGVLGISHLPGISSPVSSVFGRVGGVTAQTGDYTATQVGAPPTTRTVSAAGLATGGGDLSANRTITVTAGLVGDIQALAASAAAGASGKAADAAHVHPRPKLKDLIGSGTYADEMIVWDADFGDWVPATQGIAAASMLYGKDGTGLTVLGGVADIHGDGTLALGTLHSDGSSSTAYAVTPDNEGEVQHAFHGGTPVPKFHLNGATVEDILTALVGLLCDGANGINLFFDNTTPLTKLTFAGPFAVASLSPITLATVPLADNAITRVRFWMYANSGTDYYLYEHVQWFSRKGGANAVLQDPGGAATTITGIPSMPGAIFSLGTTTLLCRTTGSSTRSDVNGTYSVEVQTFPIPTSNTTDVIGVNSDVIEVDSASDDVKVGA